MASAAGLALAFCSSWSAATLIPTTPIAIFNDFQSTTNIDPSAFLNFHCTSSAASGVLNVSFDPEPAGTPGLIVLNNVNGVDVSQGGGFGITLKNPNSFSLPLFVMIFDSSGHTYRTDLTLSPGTNQAYALVIHQPKGTDVGMMGIPPAYAGVPNVSLRGEPGMDWKHVTCFQIYCFGPYSTPAQLQVSGLGILQSYTDVQLLTDDCDKYGQSTVSPVVNEVTSDQDLVNRLSTEQASLNSQGPLLKNVDAFYGSTNLPRQTPTGRFYLKQVNGKWWFVDPLGYLFWMSGVDTVDAGTQETPLNPVPAPMGTDRTPFFEWLPEANDPLAKYFQGLTIGGTTFNTYNFYEANLERKFRTSDWQSSWTSMAMQRLKNWGFTGFGSYSDPISLNNGQLPYIAGLSLTGNYDTIDTGNTVSAILPDPYDPDFRSALVSNMALYEGLAKYDARCIGLYAGIELPWSGPDGPMHDFGIASGCLSAPVSQPGHAAILKYLRYLSHNNVRLLNLRWGTTYMTFESIRLPANGSGPVSTRMANDLLNFEVNFCRQYFNTVKSVIKAADPGMLFLGTEIGHYCSPVVQGATGIVDAMCDNRYASTIEPTFLADAQAANMPFLITEFCVSTPAVGMFPPAGIFGVPTIDQQLAETTAFYNNALANPLVLGVDWYKYVDFPLYGDSYFVPLSNNYNTGLVSITDSPYQSLIDTFKQIHSTMYQTRY